MALSLLVAATAISFPTMISAEPTNEAQLDPEKRTLIFNEPSTLEEAQAIHEEIYSQTPFIKKASPGLGEDNQSLLAVNLPYYFTVDFDSNISSVDMNNTRSTVRITSNLSWEDRPVQELPYGYDYYDVTLYSNGRNLGTYRFDTGSYQHADWTNVPSGEISFRMSKHPTTYSGGGYFVNGDISGNGTVLNP